MKRALEQLSRRFPQTYTKSLAGSGFLSLNTSTKTAIFVPLLLGFLSACQTGTPTPTPLPLENLSFKVTEIAKTGGVPWSMHFGPDGRLFFTTRDATTVRLSALDLSSKTVTPFSSTAAVRNQGEGGVMGFEFDPSFAQNKKVYICYSYWKDGVQTDVNARNRVSSFVVSGSSLTSEQVVLDDMLGWSNHNGCRVVYGPDSKLYISIGDAGFAPSNVSGEGDGRLKAQSLKLLSGKIFRINLDGSIPSDNPFFGQSSGTARAIWSFGHRNPQGIAFQPGNNLLWSTEHGENTRDELNVIKAGKNYGWPLCAGTQAFGSPINSSVDGINYTCSGGTLNSSNYQPATREYSGGEQGTIAPSNLIFYNASAFPALKGDLLFTTLKTGRLYRLRVSGESVAGEKILIDNSYGRLRDITVGPDGLIYLSNDGGSIYKLEPK